MVKLAVVIVTYKKQLRSTSIYPVLERMFENQIPVICYDNSPESQRVNIDNPFFVYYHDSRNKGIAAAYNYAAEKAVHRFNCDGLLLLDHDSKIDFNFIAAIRQEKFEDDIVAVVPRAFSNERQISPLAADQYIDHKAHTLMPGIYSTPVMSINSGSMIDLKFIKEIGGFNEEFPLDFLDHWLFYMVNHFCKKVKVLPLSFQHDLSVLDYTHVSHVRFDSILSSESLFYRKYRQDLLKRHQKQLLLRSIKLFLTVSDKYFAKKAWQEFKKKHN